MRAGFFRENRAIMATPILQRTLAAAALGLSLAACAPTVDTRGHLADAMTVHQIQPGVSTRDDVYAVLGTPSTTGTFDQNTWYYIGTRTEKVAFFAPDVIERKVVVIRFDDAGTVQDIQELGRDDGREVELVDRTTPTAGRDLGVLEQMLGNIGRFSGANRGTGRMPGSPR